MKQKKYFACTVTTHGGTTFSNPLKLGEVVLIGQMAREHKSVLVKLTTCTEAQYKSIFG